MLNMTYTNPYGEVLGQGIPREQHHTLKYLKDKIYELSFKMNLQVPLEGKY
jgi:hypothetical protein